MKRTISAMVGQGSVNHNSRRFHAKNTDPERSHLNITYCQENIKAVYHELFDEALERYNAKQTRADRRIEDYYEKIRSGKQEKPFHEIILQVGNRDDMSADSEEGQLAAAVLEEYMKDFQERNPQLRVFSAHLHMDEATPHLHIDFVPWNEHNPLYGKHAKNLMKTDVRETDNSYELDIDLPGFQKDEIQVDLKDGYLTIRAAKGLDKDTQDKKGKYIRQERYAGACSRSFYVGDVEAKDVSAKYERGILTLSLPKQVKKELPASTSISIS